MIRKWRLATSAQSSHLISTLNAKATVTKCGGRDESAFAIMRPILRARSLIYLSLALSVFLWGTSYKLSLYHHHSKSAQVTVAKFWLEPRNCNAVHASTLGTKLLRTLDVPALPSLHPRHSFPAHTYSHNPSPEHDTTPIVRPAQPRAPPYHHASI